MNKRFLKIALLSAVCVSMPLSFNSCKDYDDDITEINSNADGLTKQIAALQTALEAAQTSAAAAQAAADRALTAANNATDAAEKAAQQAAAVEELAKSAAATAKAEAIQEVINSLKPLIDANSAANKENAALIAQLAGKLEGIEKSLSNIDLTEINKTLGDQAKSIADNASAISAIDTQLKSLNNLAKELNEKLGGVDGIKAKLDKIESLSTELGNLKSTVAANGTAIEDIKTELSTIAGKISTEVAAAVNTLSGILSQRLTSVTLMPDLYVGGIPTIEFVSAKYVKKELKNGVWVPSTASKNTFIISNNATEAEYRLNPATITKEDIQLNGLAYVTRKATSRASEVLDDIVNVASAEVTDHGTLNVKLGKSNTESLNLGGDKIYTVSLKTPIADKHLFDGETQAAVYSEYTRLTETYFQPELAFVANAYDAAAVNSHLNDSTEVYASAAGAMVATSYVYDKSHNLYDLVEGCALFSSPVAHNALSRTELLKYGMDIKFHVAKKAYAPTVDGTDQQAFVKLSGENNATLTPVSSSGQEGNQVIIGKQPIIAATLVDVVNNNVIEQKYFKVLFTPKEMKDVVIDWLDITTDGKVCEGSKYEFVWKDMAERVLEKLNDKEGMSKDEFTKIYGVAAPVITPANSQMGTLTPNIVAANLDASIPVMTWTVTKEQLGQLKVGVNTATFTKTITFTDPEKLHPNIVMNLKWVVTTNVRATTLGKTDELKWGKNNTMKIYPVPMKIPYDGTQKAEYKTNILEGRYKAYTDGMYTCGQYDIDYQAGQAGYLGEALDFQSGFTHWNITAANQGNLNEIYYKIANDADGKRIVSDGKTVVISWRSNINGLNSNPDNRYEFGTMNLQIVKILKLDRLDMDAVTDDSHVSQKVDLTKGYSIVDAYGHLVAATKTASEPYAPDYYKFYGVQNVVYGTVKIADNAEGTQNVRSLAALNMTANINSTSGEMTFQNNGAPLQANAFIIVPVTINHLWGTLSGHIAVPLNKSNAPLNAGRK